MKSICTLMVTMLLVTLGQAHAGKIVSPWDKKAYVFDSVMRGSEGDLKTSDVTLWSGELCDEGSGKLVLCNRQQVKSGTLAFYCEDSNNDADLWTMDLQKESSLPPAFLGFVFKRCLKGDKASISVSWKPVTGPAVPAHDSEEELSLDHLEHSSATAYAKPDDKKLKAYLAAYEQRSKKQAAAGSGWIAGFWNNCFNEQIAAARSGKTLSEKWFPKSGQVFVADDSLYSVEGVISQNPVRLLIAGPAQLADSSIANRCYAVLNLKNKSQLNVTQSPTPGYAIKVRDKIHGFKVKAAGKVTVDMATLRSIKLESKVLPAFDLISDIPIAQGP